jgi:7-keto-8-aminopelargonate synthetase-like enzyme
MNDADGETNLKEAFDESRTLIRFAGNNYLGLASASILKEAAGEALSRYGVSVAASRISTGTEKIHVRLEKALAEFMAREAALTFASGYLGGMILLSALSAQYDDVFLDSMAHPSLRDGIPREKQLYEYATLDVEDLRQLLRKHDRGRSLIATDGLFALTGDIAPLERIHKLAEEFGAMLVVDDAHAAGILGANGRGTLEFFGLENAQNVYQTGTFSKAFGGFGGFIAASGELIDAIFRNARAFGGSTALPPVMAAADLAAIEWVRTNPESRKNLLQLSEYSRSELCCLGFKTGGTGSPVAPLYFNTLKEAESLSQFLLEHNIQVPYFNYPVKTGNYALRMTFSLCHTESQLKYLFKILKKWKGQK